MPVTGLYFIPEVNLTSASSTASLIVDRLSKSHHPTLLTKWGFEHRLYREAPAPPPLSPAIPHHPPPPQLSSALKTLQHLELSTYPAKIFALAANTIITVDRDIESLVRLKLNALWNIRQTLKGQGDVYEVDDFKVKLATVQQGQDIKGVLVEIEYTPCQYLAQGEPIIRDFVEHLKIAPAREYFRPKDAPEEPADKPFTALDTGRQYMELLRMR
ncbi:mediator complex, subunit Med20 [Peziza echinospora]|nr:mediator complex, subunit Med20 [Peziza echinospora]